MARTTVLEPVAPTASDIKLAKESNERLSKIVRPGRSLPVTPRGSASTEVIEIPAGAVPIIQFVLEAMSKGLAVSVAPMNAMLTTQTAADLLGVSRPFLIKLLEAGKLPYQMVGKHRRVTLVELLKFRDESIRKREKALDELTAEGQKLGIQ